MKTKLFGVTEPSPVTFMVAGAVLGFVASYVLLGSPHGYAILFNLPRLFECANPGMNGGCFGATMLSNRIYLAVGGAIFGYIFTKVRK